MPKQTSDELLINHYGGVRARVVGSGNLKLKLLSLDEIKVLNMMPLVMKAKTDIEPTRLANFTQQKAKLELRITEIDESIRCNKIVVLVKPVAKSYPQ